MDVRVGLWRRLSTEELMLLNCGVGKDSWESLGLQGDPTSPFWRRSALGFLWKEWYWSWKSSTLATSCKELTHWKRLFAGRAWRQKEKGTTEDEMAGWHHWLNGHESEWTPGVADGQGRLVCCDSWGRKDRTWLSNWTEMNWIMSNVEQLFMCLLAICMFSLEKCLFRPFPHFFNGLFAFLVLSRMSCLYILEINLCQLFHLLLFFPFLRVVFSPCL